MKTDKVLLSQLKVNENNPRTITERKINLLVERLLAFPKMIEIRPVVVDESFTALGGNMRLRAFERISKMSIEDIADVLGATKNYQALTEAEKENIMNQWQEWLDNPTVDVVKASTLSESEKKEFIIADNASFGEWDYDKLANEWDSEDLTSWGVDVWMPDNFTHTDNNNENLNQVDIDTDKLLDTASSPDAVKEYSEDTNYDLSAFYRKRINDNILRRIEEGVKSKTIKPEIADILQVRATQYSIFNFDEIIKYYRSDDCTETEKNLLKELYLVFVAPRDLVESGIMKITETAKIIYENEVNNSANDVELNDCEDEE